MSNTGSIVKTLYWSRAPGKFVNKFTGVCPYPAMENLPGHFSGPMFSGTVREWYETFAETIIDAANIIHKRNLQAAQVVEVNIYLYTILSYTVLFKPIGDNEVPTVPQPAALEGTIKGKVGNLTIFLNDKIPNDEARVKLVTDHICTWKAGIPSDPPEMIDIGGKSVQAPVLPVVDIVMLPEIKVVDQITVHVLDLNVI
jgi:hypothetical protein